MAKAADFFLRTPTLTASNFAALWSTDPKFLALKDLLFFSQGIEFQVAGSILKVVFALSNWPHLHRAYLVTVCNRGATAVHFVMQLQELDQAFGQIDEQTDMEVEIIIYL